MSRSAKLVCLALSLVLPLAACGDADTDDAQGALLSTFPDQGFVGRTTSVVLIGENAHFTNASTIDFGPGVTVSSTMAVGGNGLVVQITADLEAELGPRPVSVDGLTLANGFTLASPIEVEVLGAPAQGSFSRVKITNLDHRNPFDVTTDAETGEYLNLTVTSSNTGAHAEIGSATAFELELTLAVDVNAMAGPARIDVKSGPAATSVVSRASVEVTARAAMALDAGTITGSVASGYDSVLYEVSVENLTGLLATVPDTASGGAFLQILGPSGSFAEPVGAAFNSLFGAANFSNVIDAGQKVYIILWDGFDAAGYSYSFELQRLEAPSTIAHAEPNETSGAAQLVAVPGGVVSATFSSATDVDWYKIDVGAADVGKAITVVSGGKSQADPVIEIFAPDGTTSLGGPEDGAYFDRLTSDATTQAGTHFVKITSSGYGPTVPGDSAHSLVIALE